MATGVFTDLTKPEIWSKLILRNFDDYGVMADCVNKDYEGEIRNAGDTVHITQVGDVTVNTHDDDTPIVYQDVQGTQQDLVVDQQKDWGFRITKIQQKQSNIKDLQDRYSKRAKYSIVKAKDAYLQTLGFAGVDSGNQFGAMTVSKSNIYDFCVDLFQKLAESNAIDDSGRAPDGKRPWALFPPALVSLIKKSDEAKNQTTLGDETIRKGTILNYAGFDIKQSTMQKGVTSGGNTVYNILAGTNEAITYADQIIDTMVNKDKDYFALFVAGLYVYGAKVVQPKALTSAAITIGS